MTLRKARDKTTKRIRKVFRRKKTDKEYEEEVKRYLKATEPPPQEEGKEEY